VIGKWKTSALFVCNPAHNEERYIGRDAEPHCTPWIIPKESYETIVVEKRLDRRDENDCTAIHQQRRTSFFTRYERVIRGQEQSALATCRLIPTGSSSFDADTLVDAIS